MKKTLSLILTVLLLLAIFTSCDAAETPTEAPTGAPTEAPTETPTEAPTETPTEAPEKIEITKEEWQEAIAEERFDNITILYDISYTDSTSGMAGSSKQTVKICDGKVFRSNLSGENALYMYFTDDEAVAQRKMFLDVFLALLAERDNYVYDAESDSYKAPKTISVTVSPAPGRSEFVKMDDGVVKFDKDGRLVSFTCKISETITYSDGGLMQTVELPTANSVWTFSNYGSTVITAEEIESAVEISGPTTEIPAE